MNSFTIDIPLHRLNHGRNVVLSVGADHTGACLFLDTGAPDCPQTALDLAAVRDLRAGLARVETAMLAGAVRS